MLNVQVGLPSMGAADLMPSQNKKFESKATDSSDSDKIFKDLVKAKPEEPKRIEPKQKEVLAKKSLPKKEVGKKDVERDVERSEKQEEPQDVTAEPYREKKDVSANGPKKSTRSQIINKFMDSFESEFQIPATRLVAEMTEVGTENPDLSPEATASDVIDNLGLDSEQQAKAMAMYQGLLQDLKQAPVGVASEDIQMRQAVASTANTELSQSLDRLTQKFWNKTPAETALPQGMDILDKPLSLQEAGIDQVKLSQLQNSGLQQQGLRTFQEETGMTPATSQPPLAMAEASLKPTAVESESDEDSQWSAGDSLLSAAILGGAEGADLSSPAQSQANTDSSPQQQSFQQEQNMQKLKSLLSEGVGKTKEFKTEDLIAKEASSVTSATPTAVPSGLVKPFDPRLAAVTGNPLLAATKGSPETEASVKELMSQAQYLVRQGGGEVRVEMSPEGLGQVQLKVAMQDGKLSLQMAAETQDAKKVIEKSLTQLKTSLAAQKLSVDHIKIDVAQAAGSSDQAQMNLNQGAGGQGQRDQSRQFWNQFSQNFGSQNRDSSFADSFTVRGYPNKRPDSLQPVQASRDVADGRGSELNLVA